MKKLMSFVWMCLMSISMLSAQGVEEVTLVVSGDGATKEEATHVALRSAIEQAYGTFVSANTTILNDSLVNDEIVTVSSGNIQKYTELAYMQLENGKSYVSLQATVSLTKLVKYAQSKGAECEFAGATFGANVKLYELNKANSEKALQNILTVLENTDDLFDYVLEMGEPRIANEGKEAEIPYTIRLYANQNTANFYNFMNATLKAISYTKEQIQPFEKMGYRFYQYKTYNAVNLQWGKSDKYEVLRDTSYFYEVGCPYRYANTIGNVAFLPYIVRDLFMQKAFNVYINDNIGNRYTTIAKRRYDGVYIREDGYKFFAEDVFESYRPRDFLKTNGAYISIECRWNEYGPIKYGIFPYYEDKSYYHDNSICYINMENAIGCYVGQYGSALSIPVDTLYRISNFYLTQKNGRPVPTTTISSKDKLWASNENVDEIDKINEIDGIPVCTDTEYDLGDIKRGSSAYVIFRLAKRDKYTYLYPKISNFTFNGRPAHTDDVGIGGGLFGMISPVTFKKIEDDNYHYVRVTYKPSKGFLASTGPFRAEISINMQKEDGEVDIKTVEIIGNIK